jgi:cell division protease FtsH
MTTQPQPPPAPSPAWWRRLIVPAVLAVLVLVALWWPGPFGGDEPQQLTYSQFVADVDAGTVASVTVDDHGAVSGKLTGGDEFTSQIPTALDTSKLATQLQDKHVAVTAEQSDSGGSWLPALLVVFGPVVLLLGFWLWFARRAQRSLGGVFGFGRSKATLVETQRPTTRFTDVAGYDGVKQEVSEVIDFLRDPGRYSAAGARGPRGVLMVGPPGTGKTLIARAVAGEARVPFLSVTGSAFVEMFVGVGAARTRDLFDDARRRAPAIVFIDEIDAIGGRRGGAVGLGGHDEREQTLNQLLAEMDGFEPGAGVVVLAATNRPEVLDPALLRPGRFDRQVVVPLPNQADRAAILAVHVAGKQLAPDVDLLRLARATPGFSGADLANLVNEAAIGAVREGRTIIQQSDLDAARDRVLLGRRDTSAALLPDERRAVAVHESGHALVAALCEYADPVAKVTILPTGMALGATEQLPEAERRLYSETYLHDLLAVRLAGRAAELVVFGQGSTGAAADLAGATQIAARMVREFGLSDAVGPVGYASGGTDFLGADPVEQLRRPYSEQTQRMIDVEIARLLRQAEQRAVGLLRDHRDALDQLAAMLQERETIDGTVVDDVLAGRVNGRSRLEQR